MSPALNAIPLSILLVMLTLDDSVASRPGTTRAVLVGVGALLIGALLADRAGRWDVVVAWAGPLVFVGWICGWRALFTSRDGVAPRLTEGPESWRDVAYMTVLFAGAWAYAFAVF